ncbi:MAG: type II toxin-antitoxin system VapC family toxin [Chloroherpetonaceae bacterium]|nr:type II toxin-antitoxin system VapC family toxin [Chloroherpetonaceae bacterium]
MNGNKLLWDTNSVIYYLQATLPKSSSDSLIEFSRSNPPIISFITEIELLCWKGATENDIVMITRFISASKVIGIDDQILKKTISTRKNYNLKLGDSIIAATALELNLNLLTRDIKDFRKVPELSIIDPFEIKS